MENRKAKTPSNENYSLIAGQVLATLVEFYPSFRKHLEENPSQTQAMWAAHLREFDPEVIQKAVLSSPEHHTTFAPTLGEFKVLCRRYQPSNPAHQQYLPPPRAKSAPELAELHLARLRKLTGAKSNVSNSDDALAGRHREAGQVPD